MHTFSLIITPQIRQLNCDIYAMISIACEDDNIYHLHLPEYDKEPREALKYMKTHV